MSEITINKHNKSITFINNGIGFSQIGVADEVLDLINNLQNQLQQKESIIKEAREYIKEHIRIDYDYPDYMEMFLEEYKELLDILDKGEK